MRSHFCTYGPWLSCAGVLGALTFSAACASEPRSSPQPRAGRLHDKAELYGDPGLVPSREGERARREIASANEIKAAIVLLHEVEAVRVNVEQDGEDARALLVIRLRSQRAQASTVSAAERIAKHVLGPGTTATVQIEISAPGLATASPATPQPRRRPWVPLVIALVGLGFSLGVTFDRLRRQLRRAIRRRGEG